MQTKTTWHEFCLGIGHNRRKLTMKRVAAHSSTPTRGFTLIELMIVVVIVGVLSVLAITGYRKYIYAARNTEAIQFLGACRTAQETYFQSFGQYAGDSNNWSAHPAIVPTENAQRWDDPAMPNEWVALGVSSPNFVWFQYQVRAGAADDAPPNPPFLPGMPNYPQNRPWYWIQALGDFNGNNILSTFEATSSKAEIFIINENE